MGFQEAIRSFYKRYFDFSTRSSPSEYWWVVLFQWIVMMAFFVVAIALASATGSLNEEAPPPWFFALLAPVGIFTLANIIPMIAVVVRRFHDRNMSGWWYLLFIVLSIIPLIGLFAAIGLIVLMILPGYPAPNKWGDNPLHKSADIFE